MGVQESLRGPVSLLEVDISSCTGRVDASLAGELDLSTVGDLEGRLDDALDASVEIVLVDLREVTFLDSSGLRLMLRLDERQRQAGGRLVVVRGGRRVARVFELTGADERLELIGEPSELKER